MTRIALGFSLLVTFPLAAQGTGPFNANGGDAAIAGYDPVAYFTDGRAVRGVTEHSMEWSGARWRFASAEHLDAFRAEPTRYAPMYGGYCAFAMADGRAVRIDPNAWSIVRGKLYLNYSIDIRRQWNERRDHYITEANAKWPNVRRGL